MKTTVDIADPLLTEAKKLADREGTTLRALIEKGLRHVVRESDVQAPFKLRKASFRGKGLHPKAADKDWDEVRRLIYEGRGG